MRLDVTVERQNVASLRKGASFWITPAAAAAANLILLTSDVEVFFCGRVTLMRTDKHCFSLQFSDVLLDSVLDLYLCTYKNHLNSGPGGHVTKW